MIKLNLNQIKQYIPHRYPFLLVDAVDELVVNEYIKARKAVSANEAFFQGHFPANPVMPGVLQIEAMGQAGAILVIASGAKIDAETSIYVTGITDCKFKRMVVPGDVMTLTSRIEKYRLGIYKLACEVYVGDELASSARVTATTGPAPKAPELPDTLPKPIFKV
ncbi:MAG: 3-hydroxyacyl-ACP dehydratase FabZ [Myxococcota bacterium]